MIQTHPKGTQARILLSSVFGPYAQDDAYGSRAINPMELYHNRFSITSYLARSPSFGSTFPAISSVTSLTEVVTYTREPGPAVSSCSRAVARKPSSMRFFCGVELNWRAPCTQ